MEAYYNDGRGRYGTGESYDWFWKYEDDAEIYTSSDELWTYTIIDEGIEILRYNGNEINITVPAEIDGEKVVSLDSTFDGFYELKSVILPEGITSIVGAFYGCEGLESVVLPESIEDMEYAFDCCYSLENVKIPSSAENFLGTFQGTKLEKVILPQGAQDISKIFSGSEHLKYVFIPKSVTDTYESFCDCEVLEEVVIQDGVTSIDDYAFYHCLSLKELTIPESVVEFGEKSVGIMEVREYTSPEKTGYRCKGEQIIPGFRIKGVLGSAAEEYARENGIEFVVLD